MNNKFDQLTKQMAQSVTRREALKKFGVGVAGMALACFGLANKAEAGKVDFCASCKINCLSGGNSKSYCSHFCKPWCP